MLATSIRPKRAARSLRRARSEARAAASILGAEHPLCRALHLRLTLACQLLVAATALVASGAALVLRLPDSGHLAEAAGVVTLVLAVALYAARRSVGERARQLVAARDDVPFLPAVAREHRRLAEPKERERLARSLEILLRDALRWKRLVPRARPLPGVENLRLLPSETRAVATLLRRDRAPVRAVALVSQLVTDGEGSALYSGNAGELRRELNRIRYLLEATDADPPARRAA